MNKFATTLIYLIIFLALGFLAYFYYIKPQREFIKTNAQACINKAMTPINSEVAKYEPSTYKTEQGFIIMLKTQEDELNKCTGKYNTILFSKPETGLLLLSLESSINSQKTKIDNYTSRINQRIAANKQQQDKKQACANMKAEQEKQTACMQERFPKPGMDRAAMELGYSQMDEKAKICEEKYNVNRFGVNISDCIMLDIGFPFSH